MKVRKRPEFDRFVCVAGACPDSCCKEWEVQLDAVAAANYREVPGELGAELRRVMQFQPDGTAVMTIENGRCPMWQTDGLCRIQRQLGEAALCDVCRQFPRLQHDYGDFVEWGLEMSCPEAARLILHAPMGEMLVCWTEQDGEGEYDAEAMAVLLRTRETAWKLLGEECLSPEEMLSALLIFGYQAQGELDGDAQEPFDVAAALELAEELSCRPDRQALSAFFQTLEILTPEWKNRLENLPTPGTWPEETRQLAQYFVDRYWLQAVSDYDLVSRVKLTVVLCILIWQLGGDFVQTAQLCSKEIENNVDNVEAILDGVYTHPVLTDRALLGILLKQT